jgi:sodium/potassium/calcium exchanger 6
VVASLQSQAASSSLSMFESPVTPYAGGRYHMHPASRQRTPRSSINSNEETWDAALLPLDERPSQPRLIVTPAMGSPIHEEPSHGDYLTHSPTSTAVPSIFRTPASPTASDGDTESQNYTPPTRRQRVLSVLSEITYTLLPSLHHFKNQSVLGQIASIFAAPAVMFLTLTLPVVVTPYRSSHTPHEKLQHEDGRLVDFEEEGEARILIAEEEVLEDMHEMSFNKWLTAVQCALAPLFCVTVLFSSYRSFTPICYSIANSYTRWHQTRSRPAHRCRCGWSCDCHSRSSFRR